MGRPKKGGGPQVTEKSSVSPDLEMTAALDTPQESPETSPKATAAAENKKPAATKAGGGKRGAAAKKASATADNLPAETVAPAAEEPPVAASPAATEEAAAITTPPSDKEKPAASKAAKAAEPAAEAMEVVGTPSRKRGRVSKAAAAAATVAAKKIKLDFRHSRGCGHLLTVGQGDTGQLGHGEDVLETSRPKVVASIKDAVDVVAGGMHTAVLTKDGEVFTCGCNDEGALGRHVEDEEDSFVLGKVELDGRVVMLSAGDSHTVALTEDGRVFAWGTFRDSSGAIGLTMEGMQKLPIRLLPNVPVKKVSSGADHIALLASSGTVYTLGNSEQGQLGRVPEIFAHRGGRRGLEFLLTPEPVRLKAKSTLFVDLWAGSYNTVALTDKGDVMVMGLNNYNQMGLGTELTYFLPTKSPSMSQKGWTSMSMGQHHTLAVDRHGKVFALGRSDYGRLGLGPGTGDAKVPTAVPALADKTCLEVACGTAVSYAVTDTGELYAWGMGTNGQLGMGDNDEDLVQPTRMMSKQLEKREVIAVSSGGQHTVLLAKDTNN